ncbi:MAG: nuclear transport factor 2 family protein, partial [Alphaproteobacteria bacterium]
MSDEHTVLFANEAFYQAFADGDLAAMGAVWSRTASIACIHPGWAALSGRDAVMESWATILASAQRPRIRSYAAKAYLYGDAACVICYEAVDHRGCLVATNVFVREGAAWK